MSKVLKSANAKVIRHVRKTKKVTTLDNGGHTFTVKFNEKGVYVESLQLEKHPSVLIVLNVDEIWIGCGSYGDLFDMAEYTIGNAVLIRKGRFCWLIGKSISTFMLNENERIIKYISTVQNSGVPYGYTETNLRYIGIKDNNCEQSLYVEKTPSERYEMEELQCMSAYDIPTKPFTSVQLF